MCNIPGSLALSGLQVGVLGKPLTVRLSNIYLSLSGLTFQILNSFLHTKVHLELVFLFYNYVENFFEVAKPDIYRVEFLEEVCRLTKLSIHLKNAFLRFNEFRRQEARPVIIIENNVITFD